MDNWEVAEILKKTAKLMELHGENEFKIRSYSNASFKLDRLPGNLLGKSAQELEQVDGIGKSLSVKIHQLLTDGHFPDLEKLVEKTPEGVRDMMNIKGIGPKKVGILWKELNLESIGELLYACNENRLVELKGFGVKTQDQIRQAIEYKLSNEGLFHYATVETFANEIMKFLSGKLKGIQIEFTGEIRRKCEIVKTASFIIASAETEKIKDVLVTNKLLNADSVSITENKITIQSEPGIPLEIICVSKENFAITQWKLTGDESHLNKCLEYSGKQLSEFENATTEKEIYQLMNLDFIEPELREGFEEVEWAKNKNLPILVETKDLKGILHNHSTWSDGINSLEEMAKACKDLGYEYLGSCDHSRTAFYANGLSIERVQQQQQEIDQLNKSLAPFKIFKGIESDILPDGSLDYPEEILSSFDFIVASVHSGLKMDEEKATNRLLNAIRNPYTTILGHPTGRLLLARKGYPIDHKKIIDACSENNVVIELNAHPYRLDLDWRWIQYALSKNVMISINPDAHAVSGYHDMYYGVCVARKGGLSKESTFNGLGRSDLEKWFEKRHQRTLSMK